MAKSRASFLLTGGGGGCGCGRSRLGTWRQDRPPLRRCPIRCPRARRGAWLSTWRWSCPSRAGGEGSLALRTPVRWVYCTRTTGATVAAPAALPQVAAAVAVAAAAFDMLPGGTATGIKSGGGNCWPGDGSCGATPGSRPTRTLHSLILATPDEAYGRWPGLPLLFPES